MSRLFKLAFEEQNEEINSEQVVNPVTTPEEVTVDGLIAQELLKLDIQELEEEIQYREELVEGLSGLKLITSRIETPTPTDVALIRVAANMAVAGTPESAENIIPAIESNKHFNSNSFDSKIKSIQNRNNILKNELANLKAKQTISKEEITEEVASDETPVSDKEIPDTELTSVATENWEVHLKNKLAVIKKLQGEIPHIKAKIAAEKAKKKKK